VADAAALRQKICDHMIKNVDEKIVFFDNMTFGEIISRGAHALQGEATVERRVRNYVDRMRQPTTSGGVIEIIAAAHCLPMAVKVYEKEPHVSLDEETVGTFKLVAMLAEEATSLLGTIRLWHRGMGEFDYLESI